MVAISPAKVSHLYEKSDSVKFPFRTVERSKQDTYSCKVLEVQHARQIAKLHIEGIDRGFISSLGIEFVTALYEAIAEDQSCFGIIDSESNEVLGFVAFTTDIKKLYKSIIRKKGLRFAFLLANKMFSFNRIKRVLETLLYPNKVNDDDMDLPEAELLSIVISPKARRMKQATQLIQKGFEHCYNNAIDTLKVMVAADNQAANRLYQRCGFVFAKQIDSHGVPSNIYTSETNQFANPLDTFLMDTLLDRLYRRHRANTSDSMRYAS
jgi:ribosomal protein S18 acetylase RimI-like enzyme